MEIPDPESSEPAMAVGTVTAAVGVLLTLLMAFGVDLTETQLQAILGAVLVFAPLVQGVITRGQVYSPKTVARMLRRNKPAEEV